jgi:hypothetical protein
MSIWKRLGFGDKRTKEEVGRAAAAALRRREIAAEREARWAKAVAQATDRDAMQKGRSLSGAAGVDAIGRPKITRSQLR